MGYRHYFYTADKKACEEVKNMGYDEWLGYCKKNYPKSIEDYGEYEPFVRFRDTLDQVEVFELGKLYWENTAEQIYGTGHHLFNKEEMKERYSDYVPYIVNKEGLLKAIDIYRHKIIDMYKGLLVDGEILTAPFGTQYERPDVKSENKMREHVKDYLHWWTSNCVDLDMESPYICCSWLYEHEIFELVHILKTVDWENKNLLFYGH